MQTTIQNIQLIESKKDLADIYTFIFEKPSNISWESGQYAIFTFPNLQAKERNSRAFSISSTKEENKIMFSTRIKDNPSDFKKKLLKLKKEDTIQIKIPLGNFCIESNSSQIIGIAAGIGITPFRAILYDLANNNSFQNIKIDLIYNDTHKNYAYLDELIEFTKKENINIKFISTINDTTFEIENYAKKYKNEAEYFISGPPKMVESIKQQLQDKGIKNIKYDSFYGY